ncbi:MAG: dihydroorotase [Bacteroidota bacterium]|nr:dihydroorotase [Bacteroidota bacterium]
MNIQIRGVEIFDKDSLHNGITTNIFIQDGLIKNISDERLDAEIIIESPGLLASPGWFDMRAHFADPGFESKEDLFSGSEAAAAGGFTEVALLPNTSPVIQTKNEISYIKSRNFHSLVQLYPMGAVTLQTKGEELTEMIDMYHAGAIAFSDGEKPLWHSDVLLKTLLYLQQFDGLLINKAEDKFLNMFGNMHEGVNSTLLGLKGMPSLSEELTMMRDLKILEYTGGKIHFSNISSAGGVKLIKEAKSKGLSVTCDIAAHQLLFDDNVLQDFDTNYKVNPPFREQTDIEALIEGIIDDTIDVIVSAHTPQDAESKNLEFDLAEFGIIALQTVFPILNQFQERIGLGKILEKINYNPRKILKVSQPTIKEGSKANITVFNSSQEWSFNEQTNKSKSHNSPLFNQKLRGKVVAVFNNNQFKYDENLASKHE